MVNLCFLFPHGLVEENKLDFSYNRTLVPIWTRLTRYHGNPCGCETSALKSRYLLLITVGANANANECALVTAG